MQSRNNQNKYSRWQRSKQKECCQCTFKEKTKENLEELIEERRIRKDALQKGQSKNYKKESKNNNPRRRPTTNKPCQREF
jgi:hypothetical protein